MLEKIEELENGLKAQLAKLANDIRAAEASLITTKEGYLKVQGAMEILDILKKNLDEPSDDEAVNLVM
jgi:phosphopantetheinyl transferase